MSCGAFRGAVVEAQLQAATPANESVGNPPSQDGHWQALRVSWEQLSLPLFYTFECPYSSRSNCEHFSRWCLLILDSDGCMLCTMHACFACGID